MIGDTIPIKWIGDYKLIFKPNFSTYKINLLVEKASPYGDNFDKKEFEVLLN